MPRQPRRGSASSQESSGGQPPPSAKASGGRLQNFRRTRLCKFHLQGVCSRGEACVFAHGLEELQPQPDFFRTRICARLQRTGRCEEGLDCRFAHSKEELRPAAAKSKRAMRPEEASPAGVTPEALQSNLEAVQRHAAQLQQALEAIRLQQRQVAAGHGECMEESKVCEKLAADQTPKKRGAMPEGPDLFPETMPTWSRQSTLDPGELGIPLLSFSRETTEGDCFGRATLSEGDSVGRLRSAEAPPCMLLPVPEAVDAKLEAPQVPGSSSSGHPAQLTVNTVSRLEVARHPHLGELMVASRRVPAFSKIEVVPPRSPSSPETLVHKVTGLAFIVQNTFLQFRQQPRERRRARSLF